MTGFVIASAIVGFVAFTGLVALWDGVFKLSGPGDADHGMLMLTIGGCLCAAAYFGAAYL